MTKIVSAMTRRARAKCDFAKGGKKDAMMTSRNLIWFLAASSENLIPPLLVDRSHEESSHPIVFVCHSSNQS